MNTLENITREDVETALDAAFAAVGIEVGEQPVIVTVGQSEFQKRISAARELAERGFSKAEAAELLGMQHPNFYAFAKRHIPDVKFANYRRTQTQGRTQGRMRQIILRATQEFGVTEAEIIGPCKKDHLVNARAYVVLAARKAGLSYQKIGNFLGRKDHTSIMYLAKRGVK